MKQPVRRINGFKVNLVNSDIYSLNVRTLPDSDPDPVINQLQFTQTARTLGIMLDQVNFGYSMKNTYIPRNKEYLMQLTHSVHKFVNNVRWRAEIYLRPRPVKKQKETFGFKSIKSAQ